ncbi:hypothetical protein AYO38_09105 [bacterium SCGC AG-212-C10]|nr:hypothetical protein AYO38_09105 [bacterium SCGC AG-212-C10]
MGGMIGRARHERRWVSAAFVALVVSALVLTAPRLAGHAHALVNCEVPAADVALDSEEQTFIVLLNAYRAGKGLPAVAASANLNRGAAWMSNDLSRRTTFAHDDSTGRDPFQRGINCGYPEAPAETLYAGQATGQAAFDAWKASPGHNEIMTDGSYRMVGVARTYLAGSKYGWYWSATYGRALDGSTPATPAPPPTPVATPVPTLPPSPAAPPVTFSLAGGANLVAWPGGTVAPAQAFGAGAGRIAIVYSFNATTGSWLRYSPSLPPSQNTLPAIRQGSVYWVITDRAVTITTP